MRTKHPTVCSRSHARRQWVEGLNKPLRETDPELYDIIEREKRRQRNTISLIASEVGTLPCSDSAACRLRC